MDKVLEQETSREDMSEQEEIVEKHTEVILRITAGLIGISVGQRIDSCQEISKEN